MFVGHIETFPNQTVDLGVLNEVLADPGVDAVDWARAAGYVLAALVAAWILRRVILRSTKRIDAIPDFFGALIARATAYLTVLIGVVFAMGELGVNLTPIYGLVLIVGIVLAVSSQDLLRDVTAGMVIQGRRPFDVGDQIESNEHTGVVAEVNARVTVVDTMDGERVYLPNRHVLNSPIVNLTERGARRSTLVAGLAYASDLTLARRTLLDAMRATEGVHDEPAPEAWVTEFNESTIDVTLRFWHEPELATRWRVRDAVAVQAKAALDAVGVVIAFPQRTIWPGES